MLQDQSYYQLLSPAILFVFATGFAALGQFARDIAAPRIFAVSYIFGSLGLLGDFLRPAMPEVLAIPAINGAYVVSATMFAAAMFAFYRGAVPWRRLVILAVAAMVLLFWMRLMFDNIAARTLLMNTYGAFMFLYPAVMLRHRMVRPVDRVLQTLIALNGVQLMARTSIVLWYEGASLTYANYAGSVASISFQFTISVAALAIAVNLFVMFGMEIVTGITETSHRDPLTGALNRRGLEARASELAACPRGSAGCHALIIADIDRFKSVNDRFGHAAGDLVIADFARLLSAAAREDDIIVRWGGEEFVILMPQAELGMARLYAEFARNAFEAARHDSLGETRVTASFGIALWRVNEPLETAAGHADKALYRAKREGRNRVCVSEPERTAAEIRAAVA